MVAAAGVGALAGLAYFYRREIFALLGLDRVEVAPHVQEKLPIAKDLKTVPDVEGNYDIDGVSFDSDGVIVGSDNLAQREQTQQVHH